MSIKRAEGAEAPKEQVKTKSEFIGKAWKNMAQKGEHKGTEYLKMTIDRDIESVSIEKGETLLLWPNNKREGKQDADYRVSLISPVQA